MMDIKKKLFTVAILMCLPISNAMAWGCDESRKIEKELDISDIQKIKVEAGAGELSIKGVEANGKIGIVAKLCASDEEILEKMDVVTKFEDDYAGVATYIPKKWNGNYSARIDLELTVPNSASLDVRDSSGDLQIKNVASLKLVDSSGDLTVKNVAGQVELTDSSGGIKLNRIGSVELTDSSGDIDAKDIEGDFTVLVDSSGDMDIESVKGNLLVKVDSSGSIYVDEIKGDFTVEKDGSGSIDYRDIGGEVSIPARKR